MTHLLCRGCGRNCNYRDGLDPDLPRQVTRIETNMCIDCHDGDSRIIEQWFDGNGNLVDPVEQAV